MRVGIFGGTFDPVHVGHLVMAEQCREQARLDQVWFLPSAHPPHKSDAAVSPFDRRAEMLRLALAGQTAFRVETIEKDRPGPSYTADTLDELQVRHPDAELFLILGADSVVDLPKWYEPQRIVARAGLLAVRRPGWQVLPAEELAAKLGLADAVGVRLQVIESPLIDISSRDLRRRVAAGRSIRFMVPRAVEVYVHEKKLYRPPE